MSTLRTLRLFGVLAHVDAGKTTVSERLLFLTGRLRKAGDVHHGDTHLDHTAEEKKHGITITAAATNTSWREHTLSLIDTPGHIDFAVEVARSLRVLDGAIVVLDASRGVEPQTESVWRQADRHRIPRVAFLNKLDAPGASVEATLQSMRERLGAVPVLLQHVREDGALIDLVESRVLQFGPRGELAVEACPPPLARAALVEAVAEHDVELLEAWSSLGASVSAQQLKAALRRACLNRSLVPVVCGAALKYRGIQPLLDAVVDYLPSPEDAVPPEGLQPDPSAPLVAFVFKTDVDKHVGSQAWVRVFQGTARPGDAVTLEPEGTRERISQLSRLDGAHKEPLEALGPGGIAALGGLRSARTGHTLCGKGARHVLEALTTAEPVVELALETRNQEERVRLGEALKKACFEDPSLKVRVDAETGQTVLCGVGELHLQIWLEKIHARERGLSVRTGAPVVSMRDTLRDEAQVHVRHVRQSGGPGQFAVVTVRARPLPRGAGFVFIDETTGGVVPAPFVAAVEAGARAAMSRGVREGVPLVDVELKLLDGQTHPRDSSAMAFEIAGSLALQEAAVQGGLVRLEPLAEVTVTVPNEVIGAAMGELHARRAVVVGLETGLGSAVASATVRASLPLRGTFGFVTALRSATGGRGEASFAFAGYAPVPFSPS
ncbi:MAG: elongation factor G [Myxococcaceae bacterium]